MNINKKKKNAFSKLVEKACKGTDVSTKELHREFISYGYENFKYLNLTLEDLKSIVLDISDSKETPTSHIHVKAPKPDAPVYD